MKTGLRLFAVALATFASARIAAAQCPPDCPVKGGGDAATDCFAELASDAVRLNSPYYNPSKPKPAKEVRCFDGDPGCDLDGAVNNSCTFDVDLCLRNADPSLPSCTASDVTTVTVAGNTTTYPGLASLQTAANGLLPATTNTCTSGQSVTVALKGPSSKGEYKATKFSLSLEAATAGGTDMDKVKFVCVPRLWPSHGYDASNTRSTPLDTKIDSTNVSTMTEKWRFATPGGMNGKPVTSTVTVGRKLVYTSAWDGKVFALDRKSGTIKWVFNTGTAGVLGVQSSVTLTPDGRALVADSTGMLYCLDAKKGTKIWEADAGSEDPDAAHAWSSPTVANGRVLIGIASHNDSPCTRGTLVAYDLDTGTELWRQYTVPESICYADTATECSTNADCGAPAEAAGSPCLIGECDSNPSIACSTNGDCPAIFLDAGTCVAPSPATTGECWLDRSIACTSDADCPACVAGVGGGVTATAAVSADGNDVYMASVGCLSRPSIGNSDSIFKLDAATGALDWVYRTQSTEQFQTFPGGPTYHDYGFLNGPILANVSDGASGTVPVAVGGSKDGSVYAIRQDTGTLHWQHVVAPAPTFAGFGLFNGALAYDSAADRFHAFLYDIDTYPNASNHLMAFDGVDGSVAWSAAPNENSWSSVTVGNDILWAANLVDEQVTAYDKDSGATLAVLPVPNGQVSGGVALDNGTVFVPFGNIFGGGNPVGGVIAYELPPAP